jgi:putative endonuclease
LTRPSSQQRVFRRADARRLGGRLKGGHDEGFVAGFVYILASKRNGTLYTGVTNDIAKRVYEHRQGRGSKFVKRYGVTHLVWFEEHPMLAQAIQRETSIKRWSRRWKLELIEKTNPDWRDLYDVLL